MSMYDPYWEVSYTGRFGLDELAALRDDDADTIIARLRVSSSATVIFSLAELFGHNAWGKLSVIGSYPEIWKLWSETPTSNPSGEAQYIFTLSRFFASN